MYKKHTNCILCDQIGRSYSQPLLVGTFYTKRKIIDNGYDTRHSLCITRFLDIRRHTLYIIADYSLWVSQIVSLSFRHPHRNLMETFFLFQNKFSFLLCRIWKLQTSRRNYTPKRENSFAILISVCNFHISLQFSYRFAILTFRCIVPTWTFAIFIWVCNFHMSLQVSYQFAILMSQLQHLLSLLCMDLMSLWPRTH